MEAFLHALFGDKPENLYVLLWTLQDKRSRWFTDLGALATEARMLAETHDVYIGVGLASKDYGATHRAPASEIAGIAGFWADVDVVDPVHRKENLPPTLVDATALIDSLGLAPSFVIHSGHGLQAWWLFKEPWVFDSAEERQKAAEMSERWSAALKAKAAAKGWAVDSTFDLARVLRLPGTMNRKAAPVPVRIIRSSEVRYNPSDFEPYLPEINRAVRPAMQVGELVLDPQASPPFDKFEALIENEPKAKLSWERKRRDLRDQSPSSYDMALATYAAMAGWTDQEIANLMIAHRRKHGDDLKLRQDYYQRTIAKARAGVREEQAVAQLEVALEAVQTTPEERENQRDTILDGLSSLLKVEITKVTKYLADPPQYKLSTSRGEIMLGTVDKLVGQTAFRMAVAAACGVLIPKFKPAQWDKIAQALLDACTEESLGLEATDAGTCHAWLTAYLAERRPLDSVEEALEVGYPFVKDGNLYLFGNNLRKWLSLVQGERVTAKAMGAILRAGGCTAEVIAVDVDGKRTTRGVWKLPSQYM